MTTLPSLPTPNVKLISDSFSYILTELASLKPEQLKLLAQFFEMQAAKFNTPIFSTRIAALGCVTAGVLVFTPSFVVINIRARNGLRIAGGLLGLVGLIIGVAQFSFIYQQWQMTSWQNHCLTFLEGSGG